MQKILKQLSAAAVLATVAARADVSDAQVRNLENRVSALEQRKGASGMINPSGRPEVKDGADVFVTADLLVWQAHENGLGYVVKANGPNLTKSHTREPHFNWDPGFRVGFGINTPHDGWDLYANWTYYHTKARSNVSNGTEYPVFANPTYIGGGTASSSNAKWKLNLNMLDVELGRELLKQSSVFALNTCLQMIDSTSLSNSDGKTLCSLDKTNLIDTWLPQILQSTSLTKAI